MPRPPRPDDLYRLLFPLDPQLSPDGSRVAFTVKRTATGKEGYRQSIWMAPADGSSDVRQVTIGARTDRLPRFSPDGRTLAFLSDRRLQVEEEPDRPRSARDRDDCDQVYLLPLDGGEARRLTDLPRSVDEYWWSPDSSTLAVLTSSLGRTVADDRRRRGRPPKPKPGEAPPSDYRYIDRLGYQANGAGFVDDREAHIWLVDVVTGETRRLLAGPSAESQLAWSPDGTRIAFAANRHRDPDLVARSGIYVVDVATREVTTIAGGPDAGFGHPVWAPDGSAIVCLGERYPRAGYRAGIWRFAADGSDSGPDGGTDLLAGSDLKPDAGLTSDVTIGESATLRVTRDGRHVLFTAPIDGAYELWRVPVIGGAAPERLTEDRHALSGWTAGAAPDGKADLVAAVRSTASSFPEVVAYRIPGTGRAGAPRVLTNLNGELAGELSLVEPLERHWSSGAWEIQGWLYPGGPGVQPLVVEIHGGPHALYGWAPTLEWQILAGTGISVLACNPRGSEGYGEAFNRANLGDWGDGPMADVLAGVDQAIADGLADPDRLGVTGGSYGGYLTNWIIGHTDRFRAALTCRSVVDMRALFLTGDISGGQWARLEFGRYPWEDPEYFDRISPLHHVAEIRTPLLIQHSERDLRTTILQAETLFTVLRSLRRPVRLMRVPEESHELTRSGTPFRRAESLAQVRDWFVHYLVKGERRLPPPPRNRAGR